MFALSFLVDRIPAALPPLAQAVLTALNASAVGLIALAAYKLSLSTATDRMTLLMLYVTAAIGTCYESKWLFPVLLAGSGVVTFVWDLGVGQ